MEKSNNSDANKTDRFLQTMTFTKISHAECGCDECGIVSTPFSIREAVESYKRQKLLYDSMSFISQERTLIKRDGPVSVWKLVMPPGSDPLVEYGNNSWRCILVDSIPLGRVLKMTGKGINGSSDEVYSRKECNWSDKSSYILPCQTGKSIGFVNEKRDEDNQLNVCDTSNDIVLYIIKATQQVIESGPNPDSVSSLSGWALDITSGLRSCMKKYVFASEAVLSKEDSDIFWKTIKKTSE